jgi:Flp pilus assembly protein TadG
MIRTRNRRSRARAGAAAVEFALIAPLMLLFTFGLIEIGRLIMVKHAITQATREGARLAVLHTSTGDQVTARVMEELTLMSVPQATVEVTPADLQAAPPGGDVTVLVRIDPTTVSWLPNMVFFTQPEIVGSTTMRRESTD